MLNSGIPSTQRNFVTANMLNQNCVNLFDLNRCSFQCKSCAQALEEQFGILDLPYWQELEEKIDATLISVC